MDSIEKEQLYKRLEKVENKNEELEKQVLEYKRQFEMVFHNQGTLRDEINEINGKNKKDEYFG